MGKTMKTALTIAGSDCSGGAGIQADIKAMTMNGVYAMSAITALTAQNTTGVSAIMNVTPEFFRKQMEAIFEDIRPDAVKIGMVSSAELIKEIATQLKRYKAENIVLDPVMVATSGARLIDEDAVKTLEEELIPLAVLITPNIPEAEILSGMEIENKTDMDAAAEIIGKKFGCRVLLKGGHIVSDADDLLYDSGALGNAGAAEGLRNAREASTAEGHGNAGKLKWFMGTRIDNPNTHGTGCTLSSAIAAGLAKGYSVEEAVGMAKEYLTGALEYGLDLGKGAGPMNHGYMLEGEN